MFQIASLRYSLLLILSNLCSLCDSKNEYCERHLYILRISIQISINLLQVGAIAPQCLDNLLQSIHDCLGSPDWATRKAAADALIALALHSSNLIKDGAASTLTVLEASRFDKVGLCCHIP